MAADFSWTPPLVVLGLGAVAGAVVVGVRSRQKADASRPSPESSHASNTSDLQRRYDALIRRLAEGASTDEKATIELEAAQVLMEMETGRSGRGPATPAHQPASVAGVSVRPTSAWVGFIYGVLTVSVLGGLFFLASSGSSPRSEGGSPTGGNAMGSAAAAGPQTTAADDASLKALEEAVGKTPKDIAQRIELTRAYLQRRDLMKVFDQTKAVLEIEPGNAQALTYQALVRVAMGQAVQAEAMLLQAIKKDPEIEDAYIHLAIARLQMGNRAGAEQAIQNGQRQFPQDKEQLARVFTEISTAANDTTGSSVPTDHPEVAPPMAGNAGIGTSSPGIVVVIDLPKGVTVPDTAILFVIVREAGFGSGPPIAVKRIPAANFPVTVNISDKDSMAGESLPGLVRLDARVDRDGDPLTKDPRDPAASEDNVRPGSGQILLVLTPGKN